MILSPLLTHQGHDSCADRAWLVELIPVSNLTAPWRQRTQGVRGANIISNH